MSKSEITGKRDLTYSRWHRADSISRYVGTEKAQELTMTDVDCVEYDYTGMYPVGLIETAQDNGKQDEKYIKPFRRLAETVKVPAYLVLYKVSERPNPADVLYQDIDSVRVKLIFPSTYDHFVTMTPKEWAEHLCELRELAKSRLSMEERNMAIKKRFSLNG